MRTQQRRLRVLTLQRDWATDHGLTPGPMLLAEIACRHAEQVVHEQKLLVRYGFQITTSGELVRPIAL